MQILVIVGSYRKNGNTARLVGLIKEGLRHEAARNSVPLHVETIYLAHQDVRLCRGCRVCFDQGEERCPLNDDLLGIKTKMQLADGVIIASPVFVNDVSGTVKNWIDRLAHVCHRPEFAGKCAFLVVTVGNGPTKYALGTLNRALPLWGFHIVGQAGFKMGALMKEDEAKARHKDRAYGIAQELFQAVYQRRFARPSFLSLMTFKIQQRYWQKTVEDSIDGQYWRSRGWTEPDREFYIQHCASRIKVGFARTVGAAIGRFVT